MTKTQDSASPGWSRSFFTQTTEEVVRAFVTAGAAATTNHSPRPSIVFSSKDDNTQLQKLQQHVTRVLQGFSPPAQVKRVTYNPELLTSQKRQWSRFQLQSLDHKSVKEPSNLFESMVVVGLHPNTDIHALQKQFFPRKIEVSGKLSSAFGGQNQARVEPNVEPQVLFVYPPEKQLPLKYKDLLSFCFPAGVEVHAVERTPSMSELNEILLGQEYLKQSDLSFVFRLQVADDSTLYGCCMLVEEIVQKPSSLISMIAEKQPLCLSRSRHILTTRRCYCILTRLPFFDLHFGILNSIFTEERLERVTKGIDLLDLSSSEGYEEGENLLEKSDTISIVPKRDHQEVTLNGSAATSDTSTEGFTPTINDGEGDVRHQMLDEEFGALREDNNCNRSSPVNSETMIHTDDRDCGKKMLLSNAHDVSVDESMIIRTQTVEKRLSEAVSPIMRRHHYESSESSTSFQGSPIEDRTFRGTVDDAEMEEPSSSGQEDSSDHKDILDWAKANNHGSLQIICEYYRLRCPVRGTTLTFCPMDHLHPLEFHRPDETLLHIAGSNIDLKSCSNGLEFVEAHNALFAEEEAAALSVWTVAWLCGSLRLEHILTLFAGALLEKHIVVVCSNLGILSASVLSVIALIRPYQWQSLLMPVLPNDMLDFLDAPVPYVVGVKNKTAEVQSKLAGAILVDANKNQIRSPTLPQLPQHKDLFKSLSPYHAKLVGESFLGRRRPVYECTDVQVEAAKGFLAVLRSYLDSLCSNLRSHTITNVQSNDDKVSLLLKESFIDSFPSRDRPFMKFFLDTQLFSVHTDRVLSFYQRD